MKLRFAAVFPGVSFGSRCRALVAVALGGLCCAASFAQDAIPSREEQLAGIQRQRHEAEARYLQQDAACRDVFLITSCRDKATAERHRVLRQLKEQQSAIEQAQRKQRAADRLDRIASKTEGEEKRLRDEAAERRRLNAAAEAKVAASATAASAAPAVEPASIAPRIRAPAPLPRPDPGAAAAFRKKEAEAKSHREAVERRNAAKGGAGAKGALPIP